MDAGLVKRADYFALRLVPSSVSYGGTVGGLFSCSNTSHFKTYLNPFEVGIKLESVYGPPGSWTCNVTVPTLGLRWSANSLASGSLEARLYANLYAVDDYWILNSTYIRAYNDGSLVAEWFIGQQNSGATGKFWSMVPLIGMPSLVAAGASVPVPDFSPSAGSGNAQGTATGGYKWVVDGVDEIQAAALPGTLITPPGVVCATGAGTLPNVSVSDTWTAVCEGYSSASWALAGISSETRNTWVMPVPDIPRRYRRIGTDYGALPIRYTVPGASQAGESRCVSHTPPGAPIVTTNTNASAELVERATLKELVESGASSFEDVLNDVANSLFHREVTATHTDWFDGGYTFSGSRRDVSEYAGADPPSSDYVGSLYSTEPITRYWDFLVNPHQSHKLFFKDWAVRGESLDPRLYWCPIRQQWCSADDVTPAYRNNVVLDCIGNSTAWHDLYYAVGIRNLGATRFQVVDVAPWTSYTYNAASAALWTLGNCAAGFGASEVTLTPSDTAIFAELDLGDFTVEPYMSVHLADHLKLTWDASNVSSIVWSLVGIDGTQTVVAATSGVSLAKPRGTAQKYAGSWGTDNGNGLFVQRGTDTGPHASDGISLLTMADKERINAFLLAPGSTYAKLRVDITVSNPALTVKFTYPTFTRSEGTAPDLVWESGQCCDLLYKDNAGIRFGNARWYDHALLPVPEIEGLGRQQTVVDGLVSERLWLEGRDKSDALTTQLATLFDSTEGQTLALCDSGTGSVVLPSPTWTRVQYAIVNDKAEVCPGALCPRRERDSDWAETGDWCLDAWSWCIRSQRYVTPGSVDMHLKTPGGSTLTSDEAGHVSGWKVSERHDAVDNTELDDYLVYYDSEEKAQASPWLGYFGIFGLSASGGPLSYDVSRSMRHVRAYIQSGLVYVGTGANSPLPVAFLDSLTSIPADWVCLRWNLNTQSQELLMAVQDGSSILIYTSQNLFATYGVLPVVGSGSKPVLCVSDSGRVLIYWRDAGTLKGKVYDQNMHTVVSTFTVGSCDDEGLAAYEQPKDGGGREVVLLYVSGGNVYRAVSSDGVTFGAGVSIGSGKKPMSFRGESGKHSEAWIDGTDLKARTVDRNGNVSATLNIVGTSDDAGADIAQSSGANGQWRTVVLYNSSSMIAQKYSFDALNWT